MRKAAWVLLAILVLMLIGCGGSSQVPAPAEPQPAELESAAGWPALPTEAKQSGMVEGAVFAGDDAAVVQAEYNTSIPAAGVLQLDATTSGDELAWVVYQVPDPAGAGELAALTVDVQYLDPDPLLARPEEGYYVGWGDYASELWQWSGPYTGRQARVQYPAGTGLLGPDNKLAAAVVVTNGIVQVNGVQVGRDVGETYEEVTLGGIPGRSAGALCDIQLDPNGNPQIAYQFSPVLQGSSQAEVRVAARNGASWETTTVEPQDDLEWFRLALGSGGRRALLVCEYNDVVIYFDTGDGAFDDRKVLSGAVWSETLGGLVFVNGAGLPGGELDTALAVYGNEDGSEIRVACRTYDGTTLTAEQNLLPAASARIGRIGLTPKADRQALVAISDENAGDQICHVGHYTPGAWDFPAGEEWGPLADVEEWDSFTPGITVLERPGGGLIGGYLGDGRSIVHLGYFDGAAWTSTAADSVSTAVLPLLSLDAFSSGRAVFMGIYGEYLPALHWGMAGSGDAYFAEYLAAEPFDAFHSSLAVDDDNNVHIAGFNMKSGELSYFLRSPSDPLERELVDNGGLATGLSFYMAWPVYAAGQLHVFYQDMAHLRIAHSVNENGSWIVENELIDPGCLSYILTGAGYLEEKNLLYMTVFPMDAAATYVVSGTPGSGNWQAVPFVGAFGVWSNVGDDESEIGLIGRELSIGSENKVVFAQGDPRQVATTIETLTINGIASYQSIYPAYNAAGDNWGMACNGPNEQYAYYYEQAAPGVWIGPATVGFLTGTDAEFKVLGLGYNQADGEPRVLIDQREDGTDIHKLVVYRAAPGGLVFSPAQKLLEVDTNVADVDSAALGDYWNDEPSVSIQYMIPSAATWDIGFFLADGPGSWTETYTWDSTLEGGWPKHCLNDAGDPIGAAVEFGPNATGHVKVCYPW